MLPSAVSAAGTTDYPSSINGLPVVFIKTAANDSQLNGNQKIICIYDTATTEEESLINLDLPSYLTKHPLPKDWSVEVYGGPRTSKEEFPNSIKISNNIFKAYGHSASPLTTSYPGFAIIQNNDPAISYQTATWNAPTVGNNQTGQNAGSCLLNNADINGWMIDPLTGQTVHQFLQVGQNYYQVNGVGYEINDWTDRGHYMIAQPFAMPAIAGHSFKFELYYYYTDSSGYCWWIESVRDLTWGGYNYNVSWATGTTAVNDANTSIFFENQNTNSGWYNNSHGVGFTNPIAVSNAYEISQGSGHNWNSESQFIVYNAIQYQNNGSISGNLTSGRIAYFNLQYIPLQH